MDKCEGDWLDRRLRLICLSVEQPESLRKEALGILKRRGAPEPYWAVLGSRLSPVTVTQYEPDHQLSPEEQRFVAGGRDGLPALRAALRPGGASALAGLSAQSPRTIASPVRDDADAWVAALEMMARERCGAAGRPAGALRRLPGHPPQVCQAVDRITRVMEGLEDEHLGGPDEDD